MQNRIVYHTPSWLRAFTLGRDEEMSEMGLQMEDLALPRQTHSDHVVWVEHSGRPEDTDAVITSRPGLCLCVKTADCIPILLYDNRQHIVAAIHAGWRGTVSRIVAKSLTMMKSLPEDVSAIIGPGISQTHFEVGDEVYEAFLQAGFPMQRIALRQQKWHLDLWDANRWLLEEAGVQDIHVENSCTFTEAERFYSARRETIQTGRNLNAIMILP